MGAKLDSVSQLGIIPEDAKNDNIPTIQVIPQYDNPDNMPTIRVIPQENGKDQERTQRPNVLNRFDQNKLMIPDNQISMAPTDRKINEPSMDNSYANSEYGGQKKKVDLSSKVYQKLKSSQLDIKLVKKPVIVPQWQKIQGFDSQQFKKKIIVPFQLSCKFPPKNIVRGSQYFDQSSNDLDLKVNVNKQLLEASSKEVKFISQVSQGQNKLREIQKKSQVRGNGIYNSTLSVKSSKLNIKDLQVTQIGESFLSNQKDQVFSNKMVKRFELGYTSQPKELIRNSNYFDQSVNGSLQIQSTCNPDLLNFSTGEVGRRRTQSTKTFLYDRSLNSKLEN